jgi:phosphoribosylanthranilate isomerase
VHIKICGITNSADADAAIAVGASAIGINLVPSSPRVVELELAKQLVEHIAGRALTVLVVADLELARMQALLARTGAGCLQLHGDELPEVLAQLLPHAYKAVRVGGQLDVEHARSYPGEHLLVDARVAGALGGTGHCVDWELVLPLARERKLTLAGGLTPANVAQAIRTVAPFCVDVASGVEERGQPRRKDPAKLRAFAEAVAGATLPVRRE